VGNLIFKSYKKCTLAALLLLTVRIVSTLDSTDSTNDFSVRLYDRY